MKKYIEIVAIVICIIGLIVGLIESHTLHNRISDLEKHHVPDQIEYSYLYDCMMEAELNYWDAKTTLVTEVQNYISQIAPSSNLRGYAIVEECEKYNIDPIFVLAQAEIESHFGTKGLGSKFNNVFNVDVHDKVKGKADMNKKYIFDYPNQSIEPYLQLLTNNYLPGKLEVDLMQNYVDINGSRYASDPDYETKLQSKYKFIEENTKIGEYYALMKNYAIKCNR